MHHPHESATPHQPQVMPQVTRIAKGYVDPGFFKTRTLSRRGATVEFGRDPHGTPYVRINDGEWQVADPTPGPRGT
jgi:hypothetical protein